MKSCPSCHQTYEDEGMVYCLADGAKLLQETIAQAPHATLVFPEPRASEPGPTVASSRPSAHPALQPTMLAAPELVRSNPAVYSAAAPGFGPPERARASALPWLLGIAIVLGLSGIVIALILTRNGGGPNQQTGQASTPAASPARTGALTAEPKESPLATPATPSKSPERPLKTTEQPLPGSANVNRALPRASPPESIESRPKPMFAVMNNTSFNGSRITYYPRPSFGTCQADCAGNANCKGFTWIRPGAYNPGDSAMCYLMSAVTAKVAHPCCISAVRNQ